MANAEEVKVPDIGDFEAVEIIEVLVKVGDTVEAEDPLISLESDKATMEVPSPGAGKISEMKVKEGDKVSQGDVILLLEAAGESAGNESGGESGDGDGEDTVADADADADKDGDGSETGGAGGEQEKQPARSGGQAGDGGRQAVHVPDIGDFEDVEIIEVLVKEGDTVEAEDPLISLESDKATMEVPSPGAGTVRSLKVKEGDKVSEGDLILELESAGEGGGDGSGDGKAEAPGADDKPERAREQPARGGDHPPRAAGPTDKAGDTTQAAPGSGLKAVDEAGFLKAHASPSVRRLARTLGVDLSQVEGGGRKGRILQSDVEQFVKTVMQRGAATGAVAESGGGGMPVMPEIDFSQFGEVEVMALSRIRRLSARNLHRNWVVVPHVTQFDQADITELEAFRKSENEELDVKLTLLPVLIKASAVAIAKYPDFASSIDPSGEKLIMKRYTHIGFAVDTPNGLLVPVIRDVDKKGIRELASESRELARKARDGKLKREDMQGGVFSISSLGGIGGTAFTPIVNAPEVAILGVNPATTQPVWEDGQFVPRLMLPLSLSYDHRVIDGAKAARFARYLCELLTDIRRLLL